MRIQARSLVEQTMFVKRSGAGRARAGGFVCSIASSDGESLSSSLGCSLFCRAVALVLTCLRVVLDAAQA